MNNIISNWWDEFKDAAEPFVPVVILLILFLLAYLWAAPAQCMAKTEQIGFNRQWSVLGGCQIEVTPGQWIPLESYYFKQE